MTVYLLDANVFIEAARRYYAFDLAPKFWDELSRLADAGQIRSIDRVEHELERGNDQLAEWVTTGSFPAFASTDEPQIIQSFAQIMRWVQGQPQFLSAAKTQFADDVDGWLIAYARVKGSVVVTHEVFAPDARRKVPIPNVCRPFDVAFVDTFEMMRQLGIRLA